MGIWYKGNLALEMLEILLGNGWEKEERKLRTTCL